MREGGMNREPAKITMLILDSEEEASPPTTSPLFDDDIPNLLLSEIDQTERERESDCFTG